jgi:hypothetical protein
LIDLSGIDANSNVFGDQAFSFIGAQDFHHVAGELRYEDGVIKGDVDGDGLADLCIEVDFGLAGLPGGPVSSIGTPSTIVQTLQASDFIL